MNTQVAFYALAALAATAPLWREPSTPAVSVVVEEGWPAELVATDWRPVPLAEREARFARDFPGRIGVFATRDGRTVIVRQITRPTRKLHPAGDCLRAVGYTIEPRPIFVAVDGVEWGALRATRGNEELRVRERLVGADGRRWTDVSAWYWAAVFGGAAGPWWAVTEIVPAD